MSTLEEEIIKSGLISQEKINEVKELMKLKDYKNKKLDEVLIKEGYIDENEYLKILEKFYELPRIDLDTDSIDYSLSDYFTEDFVRENKIMPLKKEENCLQVAMKDPSELLLIDNIENMTELKVSPILATSGEIHNLINRVYSKGSKKEEIFAEIDKNNNQEAKNKINEIVNDAPIVKLVNMIFKQAVAEKASDIHIEPEESKVRVRFRIDGILTTKMILPYSSLLPLISRIKIISELDITENRLPQDGRIEKEIDDEKIDMRVSTITTIYGEKVVIRLLKKDNLLLDIKKIGFSKKNMKKFKKLIKANRGIILLTGPTGSGKSTTLFAALNQLKSENKNIVTIEDPVEYKVAGINQIEVNKDIEFTFARALKSILRQDPDIIMLGEIRDLETAQIAIRAALTGHLVLTTLHTNDAISSIMRLIDMGIPAYLVAASVIGVVGQRLVRRLCSNCKKRYINNIDKKKRLYSNINSNYLFKEGKCKKCRQTGYSGRIALHEIILLDSNVRELISEKKDEEKIRDYFKEKDMKNIFQDGCLKVKKGITSLKEIYRILDFNYINLSKR